MQFRNTSKMKSISPSERQNADVLSSSHSHSHSSTTTINHGRGEINNNTLNAHTKPAELVRTRGGALNVPWKLKLMNTTTSSSNNNEQKLTKLLLNVNIQNSLGPVQVVMSPENTVEELIKAAIDVYVKEKRRSLLAFTDPRCFDLHYSQFSLESLKRDEKLINLGSRNFFLCQKSSKSFGCNEVNAVAQFPFPSTRFMDFLL